MRYRRRTYEAAAGPPTGIGPRWNGRKPTAAVHQYWRFVARNGA